MTKAGQIAKLKPMRECKTIVLASTNFHKFLEFKALCAQLLPTDLLQAEKVIRNIEKLPAVEVYGSYRENALAKARAVNQACHYPVLADDSGLEVEFLGGKPGVLSARFGAPGGSNVQRLLDELKPALSREQRKARFVCHLVLLLEGVCLEATGVVAGEILTQPRGNAGFDYDSVFVPTGSDVSLAEMALGQKNKVSHRFHAMQDLASQMSKGGLVFAKP